MGITLQQIAELAGFNTAKDQRRTDCNSYNMDNGSYVMAQRYHAELEAHLYAAFGCLVDHITDQETLENLLLFDMGLEGLRSSKLSYRPHHMVEKYNATCAEDLYDL